MAKRRRKKNKREGLVITIFLFMVTILFSLFLFYLDQPVNLEIEHQIDEENGILVIFGKNSHLLKSTGTINLYRLEIDKLSPYRQKIGDKVLKPGHKMLLFKIPITAQNIEVVLTTPENQVTAVTGFRYEDLGEKASVTYKITCDYCLSEIIKRIPQFQSVVGESSLIFQGHSVWVGTEEGINITRNITVYSWPENGLTLN